MNFRSLSLIVLCHGFVAAAFAFVFLLEAFEIAFPLLSLKAQHPNFVVTEYSKYYSLVISEYFSPVISEYSSFVISEYYSLVISEYYSLVVSEHYSLVI